MNIFICGNDIETRPLGSDYNISLIGYKTIKNALRYNKETIDRLKKRCKEKGCTFITGYTYQNPYNDKSHTPFMRIAI